MTIKEVWEKSTQFLKQKNMESPRLDAELLIGKITGLERVQIYTNFERPLKTEEVDGLRELIKRRSLGEPVAYLLGTKPFYKSTFAVSPATLIPRPETEILVERAIEFLQKFHQRTAEDLVFLELGSGSGCIVNSILLDLPFARAIAVEKSPEAAEVTLANAKQLAVEDRITVVCDDADAAIDKITAQLHATGHKGFAAIVANPPYISPDDEDVQASVVKYEPHLALFAADNGESLLKSWTKTYSPLLSENAMLMMEMGRTHGHSMKSHLESFQIFNSINIIKDYSGHDRFVEGIKHG